MGKHRSDCTYDSVKKLWRKQITINGKRKVFSGKTKQDVMLKILNYQQSLKEEHLFSAVAESWKESNWNELRMGSLRTYSPCLERAIAEFGKKDISSIRPKDIQDWLNKLSKEYAHKTISNHKSIVSQIFDYASISMDIDVDNPCIRVRVPQGKGKTTRNALTRKELKAVQSTEVDEFQLGYLILYTGCRLGEALALQMKDIDFKKNIIHITKSVGFKGNQPVIQPPKTNTSIRTVPLLPQLKDRLKELKISPDEYIVSGEKPLTKMILQRRWDSFCKRKGIDIDRHQIRHQYATMLYEAGIDPKSAQALLGHAQIATTMDIYTHVSESKKTEDFIRLATYMEEIG